MRKARSFLVQTLLVFVACFQYAGALGAEANKAIHLKVGYASITGNRIPLWATQDREFFARNGLDAELIFIASSSQGMPALLAGQILFTQAPSKPRLKPLPQARIWSLSPAASRRSTSLLCSRGSRAQRTSRQKGGH